MKWLLAGIAVLSAAVVVAAVLALRAGGDDPEEIAAERRKARLYAGDFEQIYGQRITGLTRLGEDFWRVRLGEGNALCVEMHLDEPREREVEVTNVYRC